MFFSGLQRKFQNAHTLLANEKKIQYEEIVSTAVQHVEVCIIGGLHMWIHSHKHLSEADVHLGFDCLVCTSLVVSSSWRLIFHLYFSLLVWYTRIICMCTQHAHDFCFVFAQGFAAAGDPRNTASLSLEMRSSGIEMDVVSYGTAVSACAKAGDVQGALKLIKVCERNNSRESCHTSMVLACSCRVCLFYFLKCTSFISVW